MNNDLIEAVKKRSIKKINNLIGQEAYVNLANHKGDTPLMYACSKENIKKILEQASTVKDELDKLILNFQNSVNKSNDIFEWIKLIKKLLKDADEVILNKKLDYASYLKQGFINSIKFGDEKYSILHQLILLSCECSFKVTIYESKTEKLNYLSLVKNIKHLVEHLVTDWLIN